MTEFLNIIFGDYTTAQLFGFMWFFLIGYFIYGLTETTGRDVNSPNTPKKWSWKFWFYDNWRRYIITFLCSYVLFRFYAELTEHPFSNIDAVTMGLIGDGIAAVLKERVKVVGANRIKIMTDIVETEEKNNNAGNDEIG